MFATCTPATLDLAHVAFALNLSLMVSWVALPANLLLTIIRHLLAGKERRLVAFSSQLRCCGCFSTRRYLVLTRHAIFLEFDTASAALRENTNMPLLQTSMFCNASGCPEPLDLRACLPWSMSCTARVSCHRSKPVRLCRQLPKLSFVCAVQKAKMNTVIASRRHRKKGSLDDSASDSGKILSYQRIPHDSPVKTVPQDGTAELSTQPILGSARLKQRARAVPDSCYRSTATTCRSEIPLSSETSRSRLSSANLEQNYHAYRNHPQSMDSHERTRQWLKASELSMPAPSYGSKRNQPKASQQQDQMQAKPINKKGPGWLSMFSCFRSQPESIV